MAGKGQDVAASVASKDPQLSPSTGASSGVASSTTQNAVRERKKAAASLSAETKGEASTEASSREDGRKSHKGAEQVMGRTPNGTVFVVPHTPDMLTSIFAPNKPKTALDILTIVSLATQIALFFVLSGAVRKGFFLVYFTFWRAAYDGGLGYILNEQSLHKLITKTAQQKGWFDAQRSPKVCAWIKNHLRLKMDVDYRFDEMPLEYNVWLLFRSIVDVILLNDFVSYSLFAFSCTRLPEGHTFAMHVLRWVAGWTLIFFNLWVKMDAHRVVKDYAWYWGDCFFLCLQSLVFDGVYECAPDPMYSLGYAGYYGLSLVSGSYAVFGVSLAAHFAQFLFLKYFEGPHIDRVYGEKKPLAARVPLRKAPYNAASAQEAATPGLSGQPPNGVDGILSTESSSSWRRASLSSTDRGMVSTTTDDETSPDEDNIKAQKRQGRTGKHTRMHSRGHGIKQINNLHDLHHKLFQRDTVVFRNVDPLRATDFLLLVAVFYGLVPHLLPSNGQRLRLAFYWINALGWRMIHSFGLGALLHAQSKNKWMVRHYLKHYVYAHSSEAVYAAFSNWKVIYNTSLVMTYVSFAVLCWKCYAPLGKEWTAGTDLLRHIIGTLLIALHVWTAKSSYEVLGPFGWLYGDFFIDEYPHQLYYTGIYRFLNNPERTMGGAAFFGLVLISGSKLALSMAVISYIAHWGFLSLVENPHMKKLYGQAALVREGGVTKQLKSVAERNSMLSVAQSHPKFREVKEELQRYQRDASARIEEFMSKSRPAFEGVVKDTRTLLQQSKDRMLVVRRGNDIDTIDRSQYDVKVSSSSSSGRHLLGEPIRIQWSAPPTHSNRDWIGIYPIERFGSTQAADDARLLTTISSHGKWHGVAKDEWDGNTPTKNEEVASQTSKQGVNQTRGVVTFHGDKLPWVPGLYEVRYHHDAKHDVLARSATFEIVVEPLGEPASFEEVHSALSKIIAYALDDPSQQIGDHPRPVPSASASDVTHTDTATIGKTGGDANDSATDTSRRQAGEEEEDDGIVAGDPDDFTIWDLNQAKRIATGIHACFGLEYTPEVIVAEANVAKLTQNIVEARFVLSSS